MRYLDDGRFSDESFGGCVAYEWGCFSEISLVGEDVEAIAVEGAEFEGPRAKVDAANGWSWLHYNEIEI